jgi:hypothetical protein
MPGESAWLNLAICLVATIGKTGRHSRSGSSACMWQIGGMPHRARHAVPLRLVFFSSRGLQFEHAIDLVPGTSAERRRTGQIPRLRGGARSRRRRRRREGGIIPSLRLSGRRIARGGRVGRGGGGRREGFVASAVRRRRLGMTGCGGQRREDRERNRRNARDSQNRIQQRAIFRAQAVNFIARLRDFGFQGARGSRGHYPPPDCE